MVPKDQYFKIEISSENYTFRVIVYIHANPIIKIEYNKLFEYKYKKHCKMG